MPAHYEDVLADIRARDERDSGRAVAPLKPAPDAHPARHQRALTADEAIAEAHPPGRGAARLAAP